MASIRLVTACRWQHLSISYCWSFMHSLPIRHYSHISHLQAAPLYICQKRCKVLHVPEMDASHTFWTIKLDGSILEVTGLLGPLTPEFSNNFDAYPNLCCEFGIGSSALAEFRELDLFACRWHRLLWKKLGTPWWLVPGKCLPFMITWVLAVTGLIWMMIPTLVYTCLQWLSEICSSRFKDRIVMISQDLSMIFPIFSSLSTHNWYSSI